jgi:raffinose/stachyose/melibiose transport system permease protein
MGRQALTAVMAISAILYVSPFFIVVMNSFKTNGEYLQSVLALPREINVIDNYAVAIGRMGYFRNLLNSTVITTLAMAGAIFFASMTAYKLSRTRGFLSVAIFVLFMSIMVVPFEAVMIPIVVVTKEVGLINSLHGIIIVYWALLAPPIIFLYHGFVKTVPLELEESVRMDGANGLQTFWHIVFPLLAPITSTASVIFGLQVWNDFLLPLLLLQRPHLFTIPVSASRFFQNFGINSWTNFMAAVVLSSIPMIVVFFLAQRYIMKGVMVGAMKG